MTTKTLKILLGLSIALNVFALAGGSALAILQHRSEARLDEMKRPGRDSPMQEIVRNLDPEAREQARAAMRDAATAARPDFEAARTARRQAIQLSQSEAFDAEAVTVLLATSRDAEQRGRAILEEGAVRTLSSLNPEDRKAMSVLLNRRGGPVRTTKRDGPQADGDAGVEGRNVRVGSAEQP